MTRKLKDNELITALTHGREFAWRELIRQYGDMVYSISLRLLKDSAEARDTTQEVFVKVLKAIEQVDPNRPLRPYLAKVTWHTALTILAKRSKRPIPTEFTHLEQQQSQLPDPSEYLEHQELTNAMRQAAIQLPEEQQLLIELRYGQQMAYQEMAETTGLPLGTVKTQLFRARQRIIAQMSGERRYAV